MSNVLDDICAKKRAHIAAQKQKRPIDVVKGEAQIANPTRGFIAALEAKVDAGAYGLIAEIKKASPSKGLIRDNFNPPRLARSYEAGGAACLSVLTDTPYFQGADADLSAARAAVSLPVLRKDFMLDPYQVFEARALGADCILLIMAALSDLEAGALEELARVLGMDVLVEVHNAAEMDRALKLNTRLIGVNNRDLKTLKVDIATTEELAKMVPEDKILVCESGLSHAADLARMDRAGAHCFLIGEGLMRESDVEAATRAILTKPETT